MVHEFVVEQICVSHGPGWIHKQINIHKINKTNKQTNKTKQNKTKQNKNKTKNKQKKNKKSNKDKWTDQPILFLFAFLHKKFDMMVCKCILLLLIAQFPLTKIITRRPYTLDEMVSVL